jgi:26S proteasome regulatory subunit N5
MPQSSTDATSSGAASGGQLEERIDLSTETTQKIAQSKSLPLADALALLSALEKRCRVGNDTPSLVKVCEASLELCYEARDCEALVSTLKTLSTRRSQKSKVIAALVTKCLPWCVDATDGFTPLPTADDGDSSSSADLLLSSNNQEILVTELRNITDGKMYLEAERARLTRTLAIIKESSGDIPGAASVLQDVHVETYGSISKREKIEFILEQMRLTLLKRDYVRAYIVSNKVKRSMLDEEGMSGLKIQFYVLLSQYHSHERDALELAKCFHAIYATTIASTGDNGDDDDKWKESLTNTVVFLCLSEYSNEVKDMMERINIDPQLEKIIECKETIKSFLKNEIIHYPLPHQSVLESIPVFVNGGETEDASCALREHWHATFHTRIIQHNLRVASLYYRQIHTSRLATLLSLSTSETEQQLSNMVSSGALYAKIDRPKDIVRFAKKRCEEEVLSDWAADIKELLGLVEETTYLIQKENMLQSH